MREQPTAIHLSRPSLEDYAASRGPERRTGSRVGGDVEIMAFEVYASGLPVDVEVGLVRRRK